MTMKNPVHPGKIVKSALEDLNVSITSAAAALKISRPSLSYLVNERDRISPEMALRLSRGIGRSTRFWLSLQMDYDLAQLEQRADSIEVCSLSPVPAI